MSWMGVARSRLRLSLAEWVVLAIINEEPTHGFAVAAVTSARELGRIWRVPRPIVYRSMGRLETLGLVERAGTDDAGKGPQRTIMSVTPKGRALLDQWLDEPVEHVRDVRSELFVKVALHVRRGSDMSGLVARQREALDGVEAGIARRLNDEEGFDRLVDQWRLDSICATRALLDELRETSPCGGT